MQSRTSRYEYSDIRKRENDILSKYNHSSGYSDFPHTINLTVNNRCAFKCLHCDIGVVNASKDEKSIDKFYYSSRYRKFKDYALFPFERLTELIDEVEFFSPTIRTTFVEPLMYPKILDLIEYTKKKGLKFYTLTNGWKIEKFYENLVDLNLDLIRISIDGTEKVHDHVRGIKGSYKKCIHGIQKLIEYKLKKNKKNPIIGICYTLSDHTYLDIHNFLTELKRIDVLPYVYVNFNHLQYTVPWEIEETLEENKSFTHMRKCSVEKIQFPKINPKRLGNLIKKIHKDFKDDSFHFYFSPYLINKDLEDYYNPEKRMFFRTECNSPLYTTQIEINGDVGAWGHCILPSIGNIMKNNFIDVWNSEIAKKIRMDLKEIGSYSACNKCLGTLYPLRGRR